MTETPQQRPCTCNRFEPGRPLLPGQCELCWNYFQNLTFHRFYGGTGSFDIVKRTIIVKSETHSSSSIPPKGPSLPRKVANYVQAAIQHFLAGRPQASPQLKSIRLTICEECEYWEPQKRKCLHQDCGCNMEAKTQWADQHCPIRKW